MSLPSFQVCDDDISETALQIYAAETHLAIDTETMGLLPQRDRLCVVQLCNRAGQVVLLRLSQGIRSAPRLKQLLQDAPPQKIFHFARFDLAMLFYHLGIETQPIYCTKIASKLARTYTNRHGLKEVVQELCGVELNKAAQSSDWGSVQQLSDSQLEYAANDVRYLIPLQDQLTCMLQREGRWELAQACFQHLPTLIRLDLLGYTNLFDHQ
ncbi:MAG: ribonuclease D [Cyanobacteriota bacterium]|nr:ribonuclease D [Cyanobacteriota bacterium]